MVYEEILQEIYSSYLAVKPEIYNKLDSEIRKPEIILSLAERLSLLPSPNNTISITGSKGKGTVTRSIAALLQVLNLDKKIGLLVSPHESDHLDRMRIAGKPITQPEFCDLYDELRPNLINTLKSLAYPYYLSPSGTFLLIALAWFKRHAVDYYVLETGRGARFDEVGRIKTRVSVVTSIFNEHPEYLGPKLDDIAVNKLAIGEMAESLVLDSSAASINDRLKIVDTAKIRSVKTLAVEDEAPQWLAEDWKLACTAVGEFLNLPDEDLTALRSKALCSASYFIAEINGVRIYVEGAISSESLDDRFVKRLKIRHGKRLLSVLSIPDDKEVEPLVQYFTTNGFLVKHIIIEGTDGYLRYDKVKQKYPNDILYTVNVREAGDLLKKVAAYAVQADFEALYLLGTQTYIRLCRLAMTNTASGAS